MTAFFRDPAVEPTPEAIRAALGPVADAWDEVTAMLADAGAPAAWRYYRDGGWLAKASTGRTTLAWLSVATGRATITFYFTERHRRLLADHPELSGALRGRASTTTVSGKLLPLTLEFPGSDLSDVRALIAAKLARTR